MLLDLLDQPVELLADFVAFQPGQALCKRRSRIARACSSERRQVPSGATLLPPSRSSTRAISVATTARRP